LLNGEWTEEDARKSQKDQDQCFRPRKTVTKAIRLAADERKCKS